MKKIICNQNGHGYGVPLIAKIILSPFFIPSAIKKGIRKIKKKLKKKDDK